MVRRHSLSGSKPIRVAMAALTLMLAVGAHATEITDELRETLGPDAPEITAIESAAAREERLRLERERTLREFRTLSETIEISEEKRAALEAAVDAIENDTAALRNEAVRAAETRERLAIEIERLNDRLALLQVRQAELTESLAERRDVLAEVLAALQRMGRNPPPALLVTPDDALSSLRSALLLGAVVPGLREEAERMVADLSLLQRLRTETEAERTILRTRMIEAAEGEEQLMLLSEAKREALERTGRNLDVERERLSSLANRAGSLEELTAALDADLEAAAKARTDAEREADRAAREALAAAADALRRAKVEAAIAAIDLPPAAPDLMDPPDVGTIVPSVFADADPARERPAFEFASLKAKLRLPVRGDVVRGFGDKAARDVATKGIVVGAGPGALVRAPSDGWVVYVGPFRSYGEIVIMNVGAEYRMVLAGLDATDVALGQFVLAGEPIGRLGQVRLASAASVGVASTGPTLYIELRDGKRRIDPSEWFAKGETTKEADG